METIFDFSPTKDEWSKMEKDYSDSTLEEYKADLKRRAANFKSSIQYEAAVDLQDLFKIRNDKVGFQKYSNILQNDFAEITNRIFNE